MSDPEAAGERLDRPDPARQRWTSFVAEARTESNVVRALREQANPRHRVRVEHDADTLLIHLSAEDGKGWTTIAVDRTTRQWAVAQERRQTDAARSAYDALYEP